MPVLNNINVQKLCDANQVLLRDQGLVDPRSFINLSGLNPEEQKNLVKELIDNQKSHAESSEENFQKGKYKANHIFSLLIAALLLLGAAFVSAQIFIASIVTVPIVPVLLLGGAILAITRILLNIKNNRPRIEAKQAANILNQLKDCKEVDGNGEEVINAFNNEIQEIKNVTTAVSDKIDALEERNSQKFSQLLDMFGKFRPSSPIPINVSANEVHNIERASSPTHS